MQDFIPGQRWISDTELQMGLGTVLCTDHRTVTICFVANGETRVYAKQTAPLTRVRFAIGDSVISHEGWGMTVERVSEDGGLLTYHGIREDGSPASLPEGELSHFIQLSRPTERLFAGQVDHDKWFELRYQTLRHAQRLAQSELYGLTGNRTSLIPHQLYIAHEVANRYAPRVLLADEVGLGKTIEAGLILHHQLLTERAQRVLIVVPESLVHQWLVEMLRRFNRHFSIFDEARCEAIDEQDAQSNPFISEQLVLCSLEFLRTHPRRVEQALAADWDLLVVDEAHHLQWSADHVSEEYRLIEHLAGVTPGVLLLTATPEQLGKESHFARLRLLDPDRFPDFATFVEEEKQYAPIAHAVEALLGEEMLDPAALETLRQSDAEADTHRLIDTLLAGDSPAEEKAAARTALIDNLLDRHGTGRVLFRNTRAAVKGFPLRQVEGIALPRPEAYAGLVTNEPRELLCPERLYAAQADDNQPHWTQVDPRVDWLDQRLGELKPHKVLVIAASARTALELAQALKARSGIHAAVFHEGLSIIERDRAAAWFADSEAGCQVMICSEIGSEGRNFQFAHHLVLFDLPLNPDLLEQRIGRLDRIGQRETIQIHAPYLQGSAQEILFHWYQNGLSAFEHTCPAGHSVFVQVKDNLLRCLQGTTPSDIEHLINDSRERHTQLTTALQNGRDRLLEYNSCRPGIANRLKQQAQAADRHSELPDYLDAIFDCFGVDSEIHGTCSYVLHPGEHMQAPLPGLGDEGITVTYDRDTALAFENMQYLSWEHPLTRTAMDMVLSSELGNTALTAIKYRGVKSGTLLMECLFILESASSERLNSARYLPPTCIRVLIDQSGQRHDDALLHTAVNHTRQNVDRETAAQVIRSQLDILKQMAKASEAQAGQEAPTILREALGKTRDTLQGEIQRLKALQRVNPNVRDEEIRYFEEQWAALSLALESASLRLDALRVIVVV